MKNLHLMDTRILDNACEQALKHWPAKSQMVALLEEMNELGVLLAKRVNEKHERVEDFEFKIADEMADVYFLLRQMEHLFGNSQTVKHRIVFKCERTLQRIKQDL
jgi:hypothetical protein